MRTNQTSGNGTDTPEIGPAVIETVVEPVKVPEPDLQTGIIHIKGFSPLMLSRFSNKQRIIMEERMKEGERARSKRDRKSRDFDDDFRNALYISKEGWYGVPASAFRNAMISACRVCGIVMTRAKLSVFAEAQGFDRLDSTPLVQIIGDDPVPHMAAVRNSTGVADVRCRPKWEEWECHVPVAFDARQFSIQDVFNLVAHAGLQVGIGEGRPDSKQSNGLGFGRFRVQGASTEVKLTKVQ